MFVNATPGWDAFVANLDIITTVLQYTTPLWNRTEAMEPISLASLVPDADQLVEVLTPLAPLNPEIILAIINAEINPQALLEMAISGQWNETLCSEEALKLFFVSPESLNLTLIHGVLCSLDFQQSLTELMQDSAFQMIWSVIVDQLYLSIIPDFTIPGLDLQTLLPQIFTFVETLNPADLQSLEGLQALFVNETWYQETVKQLQWMTALNRILTDKLVMLEGNHLFTVPYLYNHCSLCSPFITLCTSTQFFRCCHLWTPRQIHPVLSILQSLSLFLSLINEKEGKLTRNVICS
ncbi:uncharacterized protein [Diadema antillarum]|uniref:uncharacterized protein n=1 Tax=Diadema antillarum TaxID=105358 RepID=UPI003A8737A9